MNRRWRGGRPRHLKGLAPLLLFLLLIFLPASLLCQLYSTCIPIGEGRRDGIMTCRCKLIVLIMRFYCNPLRGGRRENGEGILIALLLCWYSIPTVFPLDEEEKRGE